MAGALTGCSHTSDSRKTAIEDSDSIPENVKSIVRAVTDDDSVEFSRMVSYPLQRPYPLRDINNAEEMKKYYHTMVDDSLKQVLCKSRPEHWDQYGWRGWSVKSGEYVWIDSLLYDVPYLSKTEVENLANTRIQEINTLPEDLRGNWVPVAALRGDDGRIMRIDAKAGMERTSDGCMRLLVYKDVNRLHNRPDEELSGQMSLEGSALNEEYIFADQKGNRVIWYAEQTEDLPISVTFEKPDGRASEVNVERVYWLDVIQPDSLHHSKVPKH